MMTITAVLAASLEASESKTIAKEAMRICRQLQHDGHKFVLVPDRNVADALREKHQGRFIYESIESSLEIHRLFDVALVFFQGRSCVQFVGVIDDPKYLFLMRDMAETNGLQVLAEEVGQVPSPG